MANFGSNFKTCQGWIGLSKMWTSDTLEPQRFSLVHILVYLLVISIGILSEINLTCASPFATIDLVSNVTRNTSNEIETEISSDLFQISSQELNFSTTSLVSQGPVILGGNANVTLEYQSEMVLHCKVVGKSETNVTWEYNGKPLGFKHTTVVSEGSEGEEDDLMNDHASPKNVSESLPKPGAHEFLPKRPAEAAEDNQIRVKKKNLEINEGDVNSKNSSLNKIIGLKTTWVDIRLPKLNMALYGRFTCRAVNEEGMSIKQFVIVPNANSSVFMKLVRTCVALCVLAAFVGIFRLLQKYRIRRKLLKYEKLPDEDQQIIRRFHNGIQTLSGCGVPGLPKCVTAVSAMTNDSGETSHTFNDSLKSLKINAWVNTAAYDDKMELTRDFFEIDFNVEYQSSSFGKIVDGKIRSLKTLSWKKVGVKIENPGVTDEGKQLDGLLTELKVLLSLNDHHQFIVNLQGAYTKKLYKRQVYLFLDSCKLGSMKRYLEIHYSSFMKQLLKSSTPDQGCTSDALNETDKSYETEGQEPGTVPELCIPVNGETDCPISVLRLIIWSTQIACGIKFLHKHKILHGNLCTENIFLTQDFVAKLGNIGYSPQWLSLNDEVTAPPECKRSPECSEFTFKSDIWMFGVTLWEMFSMRQGKIPTCQEIYDFYTYGRPFNEATLHSPRDMNELIYLCWNPQDDMRPDPDFLAKSLEAMLDAEANGRRNREN